jgi:hypothetical protein
MKISMHCRDGIFKHGVCRLFPIRGRSSMNFYNGQWLIRDFEKSWLSIRFEYVVCIFLLLSLS